MQNRYVGDVGDFAKYALLRLLTGRNGLSLGVLWYLFADESHNSDGRHISYLQDPNFARLDPSLHKTLAELVAAGRRSVRSIAQAGILPEHTVYFDAPIDRLGGPAKSAPQRARQRASWLKKAHLAMQACDLVFFDPDNGLETASVARYSPKGGKYVFWDELSLFWDRGQSLVIYHHLNRTASVAKQTEALQEKFASRFGADAFVRHFLFRRGSCRHFWLVSQERHAMHSLSVIDQIGKSAWSEYLTIG
ncbi:hypothetical protein [Bradyrhizobium sp. 195]|uniref:hypothetical protein n=1 Tax=Bradyrhizobium sp. 195 TaxID=2782662 RepID=UPI002001C104|nr:hypothetical protein [Bradyrhizobium sp. 195]UPK27021.1 hypothetical protein IVB26_38360 [Bradyrhizobium sp. 195]